MKSDQETVRQRVAASRDLRLAGSLATDIRRHADEQGWNVGERQLQSYTVAADELLAESVEENRDKLLAYHFASRRALYARCMAVSDYARALRVLRDEAELLVLYPDRKLRSAVKTIARWCSILSRKLWTSAHPSSWTAYSRRW
jgi:hypothetical protein